jgi:hypothetical protein
VTIRSRDRNAGQAGLVDDHEGARFDAPPVVVVLQVGKLVAEAATCSAMT